MLGMLDCALEAPELWEQLLLKAHPASEAQPFRDTTADPLGAPGSSNKRWCTGQRLWCSGHVMHSASVNFFWAAVNRRKVAPAAGASGGPPAGRLPRSLPLPACQFTRWETLVLQFTFPCGLIIHGQKPVRSLQRPNCCTTGRSLCQALGAHKQVLLQLSLWARDIPHAAQLFYSVTCQDAPSTLKPIAYWCLNSGRVLCLEGASEEPLIDSARICACANLDLRRTLFSSTAQAVYSTWYAPSVPLSLFASV